VNGVDTRGYSLNHTGLNYTNDKRWFVYHVRAGFSTLTRFSHWGYMENPSYEIGVSMDVWYVSGGNYQYLFRTNIPNGYTVPVMVLETEDAFSTRGADTIYRLGIFTDRF
jgi:hypothetical protein